MDSVDRASIESNQSWLILIDVRLSIAIGSACSKSELGNGLLVKSWHHQFGGRSAGRGFNSTADQPKSSPTIPIVPTDIDFAGADFTPPVGELFPRNVERGRRNQMIEDDRVLFSPAKGSD